MNQPFRKLLTLTLIILVAVAPLKAMSTVNNTLGHNESCSMIESLDLQSSVLKVCDNCDDMESCNSVDCVFSLVVLLPSYETVNEAVLSLSLRLIDQNASILSLPVILRPPRV